MSTWLPERTIDVELATELVHQQFPDITGDLVPIGEGWDNTVFAVEDRWAFRFPRREVAVGALEREIRVLPIVAAQLPLPVPTPLLHGVATEAYPWPFIGARLVPGVELCDAALEDRTALGASVGAFLRVLHRIPPPCELPVDPMRRGSPAAREDMTRAAIASLVELGLWSGGEARLLGSAGALGPPGETLLVHGDLHLRHVLVGPSGDASGVIDWGDSCLADPAVDLSFGYAALAGTALEAFVSAYGGVTQERELRARALALGLSAMLAQYAAAEGRERLLAEALVAMTRAVGPWQD